MGEKIPLHDMFQNTSIFCEYNLILIQYIHYSHESKEVLHNFKNIVKDLKYILNSWISKICPLSNVYLIRHLYFKWSIIVGNCFQIFSCCF